MQGLKKSRKIKFLLMRRHGKNRKHKKKKLKWGESEEKKMEGLFLVSRKNVPLP